VDIVDVWAQVTTERLARSAWMEPLLRWTGRSDQAVVPTVADAVAAMDEAGVAIALLSAWHGPEGPLISNEEVAAQIDEAPGRFRGVVSVDLRRPMEAVRTIREWVDGERFVGVRVLPWLWDLPPNHARYYPVYVACVDAGVPLCTQIGHTGPLRRSETGRLIPYLVRAASVAADVRRLHEGSRLVAGDVRHQLADADACPLPRRARGAPPHRRSATCLPL
jgi:hypothetical protein